LHTMEAVLALHEEQPKTPYTPPPPFRPEQIPAMPAYAKNTCIECHMVQTALNAQVQKDNKFARDSFWVYPPPDNLGIKLDHRRGNAIREVRADSFAAKAGLRAGDVVIMVNETLVFSAADFRFALNPIPATSKLPIEFEREGARLTVVLDLD